MKKQKIADKFMAYIAELFPDAACSLKYETPFQLLIATVLSAQCTDERVNIITEELFKKYQDVSDFAKAPVEDIMEDIKTAGLFRNKAKSIKGLSEIILVKYNGVMPKDHSELIKLPGVGRKTANVVVGNCFDQPSITVDTHMKRIAKRLGLAESDNPDKIELELQEVIPMPERTIFSHRTILFGRNICTAKSPDCSECEMSKDCRFYNGK